MTAPATTLRSPADLLAVIPRLLGFEPHASIVVLSLRQRRIGLTQRMDVPGLTAGAGRLLAGAGAVGARRG